MRVGSVVIDCNDFPRMVAFWSAALGYAARDEGDEGWVVLRDPANVGVNVSLQKVPEPRVGKNRLHLDLYTDRQGEQVERLLALGAVRHDREAAVDDDFVDLDDPEGNVFCVVDVSPR